MKFKNPEIEIISLKNIDVLTASPEDTVPKGPTPEQSGIDTPKVEL